MPPIIPDPLLPPATNRIFCRFIFPHLVLSCKNKSSNFLASGHGSSRALTGFWWREFLQLSTRMIGCRWPESPCVAIVSQKRRVSILDTDLLGVLNYRVCLAVALLPPRSRWLKSTQPVGTNLMALDATFSHSDFEKLWEFVTDPVSAANN